MGPWLQSVFEIVAGAATAVACECVAEKIMMAPLPFQHTQQQRCGNGDGSREVEGEPSYFVLDGGEVVLSSCHGQRADDASLSCTWGLPQRARLLHDSSNNSGADGYAGGETAAGGTASHIVLAGAEDAFRDLSSSFVMCHDLSLLSPSSNATAQPHATSLNLQGSNDNININSSARATPPLLHQRQAHTITVDPTVARAVSAAATSGLSGGCAEADEFSAPLPEFARVGSWDQLAVSGLLPEYLSTSSPVPPQKHLIVFDLDLTLIESPMINLSVSALSIEQRRELFVDGAFLSAFCRLAHAAGHLMGVASFTDTATRTDISTCTEVVELLDAVLPITRTFLDNPLHVVCYPPLPRAARRGKSAHIDRLMRNFEATMSMAITAAETMSSPSTTGATATATSAASTATSAATLRQERLGDEEVEENLAPQYARTAAVAALQHPTALAHHNQHHLEQHNRNVACTTVVATAAAVGRGVPPATVVTTTTTTSTSSPPAHPAVHTSSVTAFELDPPVLVAGTRQQHLTVDVPAVSARHSVGLGGGGGGSSSPSGSRRNSYADSPLPLDRIHALFPSTSSGGGTGSSGEWFSSGSGGGEAIVPSPPKATATAPPTAASPTPTGGYAAAPPPILHGVNTSFSSSHAATTAIVEHGGPSATAAAAVEQQQLLRRASTSWGSYPQQHSLPTFNASVSASQFPSAPPGEDEATALHCHRHHRTHTMPVVLIDDDVANCCNSTDKARGFHCPDGFRRAWYATQGELQRLLGIPYAAVEQAMLEM